MRFLGPVLLWGALFGLLVLAMVHVWSYATGRFTAIEEVCIGRQCLPILCLAHPRIDICRPSS